MKFILFKHKYIHPKVRNINAIFPNEIDIDNLDLMHSIADIVLKDHKDIDLYVNGNTFALLSCIKVCQERNIKLRVWIFNKDLKDYTKFEF